MFNRADETAKAGSTKEAVKLLENVDQGLQGNQDGGRAKEALDRPKQNLPLFLDRPAVKAETPADRRRATPAPPPVVVVQPKPDPGQRHADPAGQPRRADTVASLRRWPWLLPRSAAPGYPR